MTRLVVFDLDGTLCYPYRPFVDIFHDVFGIPFATVQDIWMNAITVNRPCSGEEAVAAVLKAAGKPVDTAEIKHVLELKCQTWATHQRLFPGVNAFITALRSSLDASRIVILTNGPSLFQHRVVQHLAINRLVDAVYASGDEILGKRKPNAECFQTIERLESVEAKDCLMIGDSLDFDIRGARAAGWKALWVKPLVEDNNAEAAGSALQLLEKAVSDPESCHQVVWENWARSC